jgi:hypothetical protein
MLYIEIVIFQERYYGQQVYLSRIGKRRSWSWYWRYFPSPRGSCQWHICHRYSDWSALQYLYVYEDHCVTELAILILPLPEAIAEGDNVELVE